jgi:predicted CopG family antitoxin
MSRKTINVHKNIYDKVERCKLKDTERFAQVIKRLLDKYEKELINNG